MQCAGNVLNVMSFRNSKTLEGNRNGVLRESWFCRNNDVFHLSGCVFQRLKIYDQLKRGSNCADNLEHQSTCVWHFQKVAVNNIREVPRSKVMETTWSRRPREGLWNLLWESWKIFAALKAEIQDMIYLLKGSLWRMWEAVSKDGSKWATFLRIFTLA